MLKTFTARTFFILKYLIMVLVLLLNNSCADETSPTVETGTKIKDAILEWHGDYEVDGCGYFIIIDDETYKPENEEVIGAQFKKTVRMNVIVKYVETNTFKDFYCGGNPVEFSIKSLKIIWIRSN